jgi:putative tryptophan/tyrosine transport system substrate-binding protein
MGKRIFLLALGAMLFALSFPVEAQQPKKVPRIGFLASRSPSSFSSETEAFRQGLRELGYVEGQNIGIEYRYAEGKTDRFAELATELVRLKVDVIVTSSTPGVLAVKRAPPRFPLSSLRLMTPLRAGWSPASHGRVGTLRG